MIELSITNFLEKNQKGNWLTHSGTVESIVWKTGFTPPNKETIETGVKAEQKIIDDTKYQRDRAVAYPEITEQLDLLYHDMTSGKGDKTGEWYKAVNKVKTDNPKSS